MRVLIIDDEPLAITRMMVCLKNFPDVTVARTCQDGESALRAVKEEDPDLIFLDVRMPVMGGFDVMEALEDDGGPLVVFVTAYDHFAVRAFEAHAIDYLLKPVETDRLGRALDRARSYLDRRVRSAQTDELWGLIQDLREGGDPEVGERVAKLLEGRGRLEDSIWIKDRGRISRVEIARIEWIRAVRDYVCIFVPEKSYLIRETMKKLEEKLDPSKFIRVHRSAIVNQSMVRELRFTANGGHVLVMNSGEEIRVGRTYSPMISRRFARRAMS